MIFEVGSWRELDDAIADTSWRRDIEQVHSTLVWRGLARSDYSNISSLARLSEDYPRLERHLVRNFRKYAHREAPGPTMWDWLSLAQHHGLPTRLLDWTFSPLVALHFATASWADDEAILWAVDCEGAHELLPAALLRRDWSGRARSCSPPRCSPEHAPDLDGFDELTEDEPFVLFFEPPSLDERIVNQAAVLSAISDPRCHMEEWLAAQPELWRAWRIRPAVKTEIRERLDQAHVNERVLMPGLDGLAAWLRRYYSPRRTALDEQGATMAGGEPGVQREGSMG